METTLKISALVETIKSYDSAAQASGGKESGHAIAKELGLLEADTNARVVRRGVVEEMSPINTLCLTVGKHVGTGGKVTATAFGLTDAVLLAFDLTNADLAAAMMSTAKSNVIEFYKKLKPLDLEAKARTHLGLWLLGMAYRSGLVDILAPDGTSVSEVETYTPSKDQPASIAVIRIAKSSNQPVIAKKFKLLKGLTREEAERMAQEWIDSKPERAGSVIEFMDGYTTPDYDDKDKIVSARNSASYHVVEKGGAIADGLSYTSFKPYKLWTNPIDEDGRALLKGRYFIPDADQMKDQPWVRAANRLESVGYKVNKAMLDLVSHFESRRKDFLGVTDKKRRGNITALDKAREIGGQTFYQRCSMDFRGRLYLSKSGLNYQGGDLSRSLIDLAKGEKLTKEGFESLLLHAANCHGRWDGQPRSKRIEGATASIEEWKRWGLDPVGSVNDWFSTAIDKPFSFIRACIELANVGVGDVSHILTEVDGSNNGLQWHSIFMGDKTLAQKTNLLGGDRTDFYKAVGKRLVISASEKERRKIAKLASMEFQYGASPKRIARDLRRLAVDEPNKYPYLATLDTKLVKGARDYEPSPAFKEIATKAVDAINAESSTSSEFKSTIHEFYKSKILMGSCTESFKKRYESAEDKSSVKLPKALEIFLAGYPEVDHHEMILDFIAGEHLGDRAITYVTPSNFPVHIQEFKSHKGSGRLYLSETTPMKVVTRIWGNEIDTQKMLTGSLANLTHSMDAAHCHLILDATDYDLVTIHDAYACHPNNGLKLVRTIMEQMKRIAEQHPIRLILQQGLPVNSLRFSNGITRLLKWDWLEYQETADGELRAPLIDLDSDLAHDMDHRNIPGFPPNGCVSEEALEAFS